MIRWAGHKVPENACLKQIKPIDRHLPVRQDLITEQRCSSIEHFDAQTISNKYGIIGLCKYLVAGCENMQHFNLTLLTLLRSVMLCIVCQMKQTKRISTHWGWRASDKALWYSSSISRYTTGNPIRKSWKMPAFTYLRAEVAAPWISFSNKSEQKVLFQLFRSALRWWRVVTAPNEVFFVNEATLKQSLPFLSVRVNCLSQFSVDSLYGNTALWERNVNLHWIWYVCWTNKHDHRYIRWQNCNV